MIKKLDVHVDLLDELLELVVQEWIKFLPKLAPVGLLVERTQLRMHLLLRVHHLWLLIDRSLLVMMFSVFTATILDIFA